MKFILSILLISCIVRFSTGEETAANITESANTTESVPVPETSPSELNLTTSTPPPHVSDQLDQDIQHPAENQSQSEQQQLPPQQTQPVRDREEQAEPHEHEEPRPEPEAEESPAAEDFPPKISIQPTFTFKSERRCLDFLKRLKSKGQNEHSYHPLSCHAAFDGILCWRPADPGETIQQVCPNIPTNLKNYARRECSNGQWRDYGSGSSERLDLHVTQTDYSDCFQVAEFIKKHGVRTNSAEQRGPTVSEYGYYTAPHTTGHPEAHNAPVPDDHLPAHSTANTLYEDNAVLIPRPWLIVDIKECQDFLQKHGLADTRRGEWCSGGSDGQLCWPATAPGTLATQPCPRASESENHLQASRHCGLDGKWNVSRADGSIEESADPEFGWTNFDACPPKMDKAHAGVHLLLKDPHTDNNSSADLSATEPSKMALTSQEAQPWLRGTEAECVELLKKVDQLSEKEAGSCKGGTDGSICWPTTKKDVTVTQPCPNLLGLDSSKSVSRTCKGNGEWTKPSGSYADCISPELKNIIKHDYHLIHPDSSAAHKLQLLPWMFVNFLVVILFL